MALCEFGGSPKPDSPAWFTYDQAYVAGKFGNVAGWLTMWAMGLPDTPQNTADFCSVDPPTDLPTAADYAKIVAPPLALLTGTYTRFGNQIRSDKWSDLCQCNAAPGDSQCQDTTTNSGALSLSSSYALASVRGTFPSNATRVNIGITIHNSGFPGTNGQFSVHFLNAAGQLLGTVEHQPNNPQYGWAADAKELSGWIYATATPGSATMPAGATAVEVWATANVARGDFWSELEVIAFCANAPTTVPPPATPPTPTGFPAAPAAATCGTLQDVCNALLTVNQKLDYLRLVVDLIHIQDVPTGLQPSTAHQTLTGEGETAVSGIRGLSVTITGFPSWIGGQPGNPDAYFDFGHVSWGSADGWIGTRRIIYTSTLILDIPPLVTRVGHSFTPGVTGTIQELVIQP